MSGSTEGRIGAPLQQARIMRLLPVMNDLLYVAITVGFFAIAWIYVRAAERL